MSYLVDCFLHVVYNQPNMINIKNINKVKISTSLTGHIMTGNEFQDVTHRICKINGVAIGTTKMELVPSIRMS